MKKTLLSLSLIGGMLFGYSQTTIWMDDFNDEDISDWTLVDADMDGYNWGDMFQVTDQFGDPITPTSLISRSWQQAPLTPDNWAISPAIDLSSVDGNAISLEYITQVPAFEWDQEHYSVYVATSNSIADLLASETQMSETLGDASHSGAPVAKSFDISAFAGEPEVYIAFRHHDVTDMDFISIDDVKVVAETLSTDDLTLSKSSLSLYPNPASDLVKVNLGDNFNTSKVQITLTNLSGKQVSKVAYNANGIDVSNLPAGLYIVTATDGKNTVTKKLIKK
ncbi:T9SS type A sorting domain-containing protein [Weeksellaceae bacterium KMM 9713]|uniref:T9SS type A sorting domain-containing protein n=1 Tax=Profundicola chukchiensis TaxID=2961959 RepID=A0A9X4MXY2_9FLAO|nr:T9SS type A sorting domain-containing protein [Profundicola chukchiensis]MDG4945562.1 T9SS type A sorting domain-containing protein [Profundicola chukchiensis]MDG4949504.1 T9SS type A sorting domain-containing protein [Profundicola chukchiensis]